ncbi:hypothetical protein V6N11_043398 [Hibiscus sabdariffa]|uniref:Uncharacterized protein n=1 Tax=Hibiscus sabdariffa TaxID=183260 RepID=A0ABR2RC74_9ROSI
MLGFSTTPEKEREERCPRLGCAMVSGILGEGPKKKQNFAVLEGHPAAQQAVETSGEIRSRVKKLYKEFQIYRWSPDHPTKPFLRSYFLHLPSCGPMVLDALQKIKAEEDSSLSYRRS